MSPKGFQLALAQTPAALRGVDERLTWLQEAMPGIAAGGADLVLLPELFATGYRARAEILARAESRDGPIFEAMARLARENGIAQLYGYPERAGGQIYNAAQCLDRNGVAIGHHRKLAIPPGFEKELFQPGRGVAPFDFDGLRCAILICYDAEFPETARQAASLGAEVLLVPTALGRDWAWVAQQMIPTRAFENGVYLAYANSAGIEGDFHYLGQSVVAAPNGQELARAGPAPQILQARIDPEPVVAARARLPYLVDRQKLALRE